MLVPQLNLILLSVQPHFSFIPTGSGGVNPILNLAHLISLLVTYRHRIFAISVCSKKWYDMSLSLFTHILVSDHLIFGLLLSLLKTTFTFTFAGGGV